ncbi:FecCD family ABC transporter permease [Clostridium hydrogeniformans]|uniref:FecCD family ABC transporter permease n=1 Tax=Clostridium hydrogeniformans TaxID=349933 RepID=UPI000489E437|nr:iron ABC transporter permease [Clostridium hydrogeniformans]
MNNNLSPSTPSNVYFEKSNKKFFIIIATLISILLISLVLSITFGSANVSAYDAYRIIIYNTLGIPIGDTATLSKGPLYDIVWHIRFPRVLLGSLVGMGLSIVGCAMQATVNNPLADPYILGLSSGASLGATFSILIGVNGVLFGSGVTFGAFTGALISSIFVYLLSNVGGRITSTKLILSGLIISSICSAFTSFIIFISNNAEGMKTVTFWMMGGLTSASFENLKIPSIIIVIGIVFFLSQFRVLNTMVLGEEASITLGIDLSSYRKIYMLVSALITGVIVSVCGTVGFVGLMIPHISRLIVGSDHKKLLPISALLGSILLIWTDVLARVMMKGLEIPIGVLTSMLGAPFLMWLLIKKSYSTGGKTNENRGS